ncbi:A.superbus venom factor 1-like [Pantherophis guttatus]|uniref:A.superbus venom factor 1-like n=1 Tax=Pantherophis guttatus TaxID=94885 RepID=A0ABM3ZDI5_PANGU|nr:A.superbus venom factor 1-like [Pantherophis guttatus]
MLAQALQLLRDIEESWKSREFYGFPVEKGGDGPRGEPEETACGGEDEEAEKGTSQASGAQVRDAAGQGPPALQAPPRRPHIRLQQIQSSKIKIAKELQLMVMLTLVAFQTKLNEDFTVSASGDGKATMTILTVYNAQLQEDANICNKFHLDVSVENVQLDFKQAKGAKGALKLKICTRYLGEVDSTMTIIDVSMLTGFLPDVEDLTRLSKGVNGYISKFEIDNNMAQKGTVIIYLDKVSHSENECLQFKILKHFEVGFIQPGSVKVYSYYNLDEQCTRFYHPDKGTGLLNKICDGNICRCAEETCSLLNQQKKIDLQLRIQKACEPNVDYVYKTKLLRIEEKDGNDIYVMDVLEVIKSGTDRNPQAKPREYVSQRKCQETLNLKLDNDYLIWGLSSDLWPKKDDISYLITKNTWIERWPYEEECQDEEFQNLCDDFAQLSNTLTIFGCPT